MSCYTDVVLEQKNTDVSSYINAEWRPWGLQITQCNCVLFYPSFYSLQAVCYLFFLAVLSFALIYGSTRADPNKYNNHGDRLRALCEVISILFIMFFIVMEIDQMQK